MKLSLVFTAVAMSLSCAAFADNSEHMIKILNALDLSTDLSKSAKYVIPGEKCNLKVSLKVSDGAPKKLTLEADGFEVKIFGEATSDITGVPECNKNVYGADRPEFPRYTSCLKTITDFENATVKNILIGSYSKGHKASLSPLKHYLISIADYDRNDNKKIRMVKLSRSGISTGWHAGGGDCVIPLE